MCYLVIFLTQTVIFDWCVHSYVRIKDQNIIRTHVVDKRLGLHPQISITTPHLMVNKIGKTYVFSREINKGALMITISKSG